MSEGKPAEARGKKLKVRCLCGNTMLVAGPKVRGRLLASLVDKTVCGNLVMWNNPKLPDWSIHLADGLSLK